LLKSKTDSFPILLCRLDQAQRFRHAIGDALGFAGRVIYTLVAFDRTGIYADLPLKYGACSTDESRRGILDTHNPGGGSAADMNGAVRTGDTAKLAADAVLFVNPNAAVVAARYHVVGTYLDAGRPFAMMAGDGGGYITGLKKGEPGLRL